MTKLTIDLSQSQAVTALRILYPIWFVVGVFSILYVPSTLIMPADAATTANNILTNELLFNASIVGSLIVQLIHVLVVLVLYQLFKTVNKDQASLIVILGLLGVPIAMLNELNKVAALLLSKGAGYLTAFEPAQLQSLMMFFLDLNEQGIFIAGIFWGLWLFPIGFLILESRYFPRIIGYLMVLAGIAYVLDSFVRLLLPSFSSDIFLLLTNGEVLFMIWVFLKGANLPEKKS